MPKGDEARSGAPAPGLYFAQWFEPAGRAGLGPAKAGQPWAHPLDLWRKRPRLRPYRYLFRAIGSGPEPASRTCVHWPPAVHGMETEKMTISYPDTHTPPTVESGEAYVPIYARKPPKKKATPWLMAAPVALAAVGAITWIAMSSDGEAPAASAETAELTALPESAPLMTTDAFTETAPLDPTPPAAAAPAPVEATPAPTRRAAAPPPRSCRRRPRQRTAPCCAKRPCHPRALRSPQRSCHAGADYQARFRPHLRSSVDKRARGPPWIR